MGNEPAPAEEKLPLETSDAGGRVDHEDEAQFKERLVTGGGPRVPRALARRPQRLPVGAGKESDKGRANVRIPAAAYEDKEKYVTHYSNLQFYLRQGMRLKKVHRVIEFDQEPWMEPYIRMNTEFRKQAKSDFETDFYKLMNNSVFGKTMENLRNRVYVKIVRDWETDKIRKLLSSPSFDRFTVFGNDMAGIYMRKTKLVLNKPVYTGMTILENSKILMYEFFYNHMKARYGHKCELVYTDIDSLILDILTEDVFKDMQEHSWLYDTSNYPKDHPLYDDRNKKALGKMKDERGGGVINEVVAVRPKMYSVEVGDLNIRKAKGVKKKCD